MADSFDYGRTCCLPRRPSQRATLARCHQMIREPLSTRPVSSIVSPTVTVHAAELSHSAAVWKCYVGAVSLTKWSPEERRYRTFPYCFYVRNYATPPGPGIYFCHVEGPSRSVVPGENSQMCFISWVLALGRVTAVPQSAPTWSPHPPGSS